MKTIAQFLLTVALSLAVTTGLNTDVRGKIERVVQRVEATVTQATDFALQTASSVIANTNAQASTNANVGVSADSKSSASASANANGGGHLSTMLNDILGQGQANASASANAQGSANTSSDGWLFNLIFGGQGSANGGLGIGIGK